MKRTKKTLSALLSLTLAAGCMVPVSVGAVDLSKYEAYDKDSDKIMEVIGKAKSALETYSGYTSETAEETFRHQLINGKNVDSIGRIREGSKWYDTIMSFRKTKSSLKEYSFASNKDRIAYVLISKEDYDNLQDHPDEYQLDYIDDEPVIVHDGKTKSLSATPSGKADEVPVYAGNEQFITLEGAITPYANEIAEIDRVMTEDGYWNISDDKCDIFPAENSNILFNGKSGNDTYIIKNTKGIACIRDCSVKNSEDSDTVIFDYDTSESKMSVYRDANDLYIADETNEILVYIQNYFTDSRVEYIKISEDLTLEFDDVYVLTDVINGTEKRDTLNSYEQATLLLGYEENDTIKAATGENYWAFGDDGDDTISVPFGNALVFGGEGADVINITNAGKSEINLNDYVYSYGYNVIFAGGDKDTVSTYKGENLIVGGAGDDTLKGGFGDDIFVYYHGDGNDTITESMNAFSHGGTDYIYFADMTPDDITVSKRFNSWTYNTTLTINTKDGSGSLKIPNAFQSGTSKIMEPIEYVVFADGTIWNLHDLVEQGSKVSGLSEFSGNDEDGYTIIGTDGDDKYNTGKGNDVIRAGKGNDYIHTGGGTDTVIFCRGDGHDIFEATRKTGDTVIFEDINSDEVRIARLGYKLTIKVNGSDDALEIPGIYSTYSSNANLHVAKAQFADGVEWSFDEMLAMAKIEATDGDDTFGVINETHILCCGKGNDTINGSSSSDTYLYELGDGHDKISEQKSRTNITNTIVFGEGIDPETINVSLNKYTIVISIPDTEDSVTISKGHIDRFTFADGTTWTESDLLAKVN